MIRFIAAIDKKRGIANDHGIPWDLPSDRQYYRERVAGHVVVMGRGTYNETRKPVGKLPDYVVTNSTDLLRPGFEPIADPRKFMQQSKEDIWVIGGAGLYNSIIDLADELYLTLVDQDFDCTKFFPEYSDKFELAGQSEMMTENGINFRYTTWRRKKQTRS